MEIKEILYRIVRIGIVVVFLTPLILGPFGLNMSEYPKAVFFRSVIEIIFAFYVFLILLDPNCIPKKSPLLFFVILFDAILLVAGFFGINFYRSFFGEMQRGEGIILYLHLLAFFVMAIGIFRKRQEWLWLLKSAAIISGIEAIAGVFQQLKIFKFYNVESIRLSGTLSNPDLFGSFMTLSIFLTVFLLICENNKKFKIFWLSLIAVETYTLFFSGTRAAWLGLGVGIICIYLLNYKNIGHKKRVISLFVVLFLMVLVLILPWALQNSFFRNSFVGQRIQSAYSIDLQNRLGIWKTALSSIKDRPILGWGAESFSFVYDKYIKTGYIAGIYFDRPHNKILEVLGYGGILGLLSYLAIFCALFYLIFRYRKLWDGYNDRSGILFASILFAFFVSGLVQNVFCFDHIGTYILFFLMAGFVNNNFSGIKERQQEQRPVTAEKIIFSATVFVFMFFVMYQVNIKPTVAAMNFNRAIQYESTDVAKALEGYRQGINMDTLYDNDLVIAFSDRVIYLLENNFGRSVGDSSIKYLLNLKPFLYADLENKDVRPNNIHEFLIRIDEWAYLIRKDPSYLNDMSQDIKLDLAFNPNISTTYKLLGELEILQDKNNQGEKDIKKGCVMDAVGCNGNQAELYRIIGIAYYKKGDINMAFKNFRSALDTDYNSRMNGLPDILSSGAQLADSISAMYYNYYNDFKNCKALYLQEMKVYPEYKDILQQHLDYVTADYEKNKKK
jgi:O-antigen ligase/tetratricopeptide (TPR) repeat protein